MSDGFKNQNAILLNIWACSYVEHMGWIIQYYAQLCEPIHHVYGTYKEQRKLDVSCRLLL